MRACLGNRRTKAGLEQSFESLRQIWKVCRFVFVIPIFIFMEISLSMGTFEHIIINGYKKVLILYNIIVLCN